MNRHSVKRLPQIVLMIATILLSWWGMQVVHELGHILAAWLSGGRVERTVLPPLGISRTDLAINPHPLLVAWTGPIFGVLVPLGVYAICTALRAAEWFVIRFFAGGCLVANGAYIGIGSFVHVGDAGDVLRLGTPIWVLWIFGLLCIPSGLWMWHGLGPYFGLGPHPRPIHPRIVVGTAGGCAMLLILGWWIGWA